MARRIAPQNPRTYDSEQSQRLSDALYLARTTGDETAWRAEWRRIEARKSPLQRRVEAMYREIAERESYQTKKAPAISD